MESRTFPEFSLTRLIKNTFRPKIGEKICILIDLPDLKLFNNFEFINYPEFSIQKHAHDSFYKSLHDGVMDDLNLIGGEMFAYMETGGSNLDLPASAVTKEGNEISLERDVFEKYDIILCISTYSATAPLTAFAKRIGFRGATLHGVNDIILGSGLAVDYNEVSKDAEKLRRALTRACLLYTSDAADE